MITTLTNGKAIVINKIKMVSQIKKYHCGQTCVFDVVFDDDKTERMTYQGKMAETSSLSDRRSIIVALAKP